MEKTKCSCQNLHPFVVFWLGVLTGALVVGLAFFYGVLKTQEYQNAVFRLSSPAIQTMPIGGDKNIIMPIGGDKN